MKYKNEFNENKKYRLGNYQSGFDWHTIRPGQIVDIPEHIGNNLNLTPIKVEKEVLSEEDPANYTDAEAKVKDKESGIDVKEHLYPEEKLKKMTKDALNDYAAKIGLDEVNTSMKKDEMISDILGFQETIEPDDVEVGKSSYEV